MTPIQTTTKNIFLNHLFVVFSCLVLQMKLSLEFLFTDVVSFLEIFNKILNIGDRDFDLEAFALSSMSMLLIMLSRTVFRN